MPKILVIDDDAWVRHTAAEILTRSGYSVAIAADGPSGIAAAAKQSFAAAIVDLSAPQMHGLDTIRAFRRLAPDMPLIAMSGLLANCPGNAPDFLGMSANLRGVHRLDKPFRHEDLLALVARCCTTLLEAQTA